MSLTTVLANKKTTQFLRGKIRNPGLRPVPEVRVPPNTSNPSRMGTAFDYALRFGLSARFEVETRELIAERGLRLHLRRAQKIDETSALYQEAKESLAALQPGLPLPPEAAKACFFLADLDVVYRAPKHARVLQKVSPEEVTELQALYEVVPWQEFQSKERLVLNPVFGEGSRLLGGADADLVLDDQLLEIKTVRKQALTLEMVRQLAGYALLANRYGVNGDGRDDTILRLGVYHSRAGMLHHFNLRDCLDAESDHDVLDFLLSFSTLSAT